MEDYDRDPRGWEITRTKTALVGITLGFAGMVAIAGAGTESGLGNQSASLTVAVIAVVAT